MHTTATPSPVSVNFHLWPKCNLHCTFCYAGFPTAREPLPVEQAKDLLNALVEAGTDKVTLVGGEPTLHPHIADLVRHAAAAGLTTCIVTNGARLLQVLDAAPGAVHWVGLSIESAKENVQAALGRGTGDHVARTIALADEVRRRGIRLKVNTVVTAANCDEDLSDLIRRICPERWKAFQVLKVEGENDGRVEPLLISEAQFAAFVARHAHLGAEGLGPVAEDNDAMRGSYVMIDPQGRFFNNETGVYTISKPILEVGVGAALQEVGWSTDKFVARGGQYVWKSEPAKPVRPPIVAVEGLDGTGKSTTVALLAERLGARVIHNPPEEVAAERAAADLLDDDARREWYLKANRLAMQLALDTKGQPVVLDRSVASTLAFGAAARGQVATRDDLPKDLKLPDAIVLLSLPEAARRARHAHRGDTATAEEDRLATDHAFRERVLAGYANLCTAVVDAIGTPEQVVEAIEALVRSARSGDQ